MEYGSWFKVSGLGFRAEDFGVRVKEWVTIFLKSARLIRPSPSARDWYFRNVKRFRGGLVFKAHRLVYHSTLGWRVIKKKKIGILLPNNQRQHRTLHVQTDVLPYALC